MKIFLDANIIIDFLDSKRQWHKQANEVIKYIVGDGDKIVISEDILTTVYYVCKKDVQNKKLFAFFEMIIEEFEVVCFGKDIIEASIELCVEDKKLDFEDVLQATCAKKAKCDLIITNDKNFAQIGVTVKTIENFIK